MEAFLQRHELQLYAVNFPDSLVPSLYQKLQTETLDAGNHMQILKQVDEFNQFLSQRLVAKNDIPVNSDVFLIDHAWTTRITDMRKGLVENPRLLYRMKGIVRSMGEKFDLPGHEEEVEAWEGMYDLDN